MIVSIISDTHSHLGQDVIEMLHGSDEIWHAGDIGDEHLIDQLSAIAPFKAVYGNIDGAMVRRMIPHEQFFDVQGIKVYMIHIAGYPGRYNQLVKKAISDLHPDIVVCGHSHILKIMRDPLYKHLHVNPGACGVHGFHIFRTMVRLEIEDGKIKDLKVVEFGKRGAI